MEREQDNPEDLRCPESLRERKRRETLQRITETGLELFLANGYEATTLDAVAVAAGISRRTFFSYFTSKEELLLAWQSGLADTCRAAVARETPEQAPIDAVRSALLKLCARYQNDEIIAIDRLMRSNPALMARKQAKYVEQEEAVREALIALWPDPARRAALGLVAMAAIGAMRLAVDAWSRDDGVRPIAAYLDEAFDALKAEI